MAGEIVSRFDISGPSISPHLSLLEACDLVAVRREGNRPLPPSAGTPHQRPQRLLERSLPEHKSRGGRSKQAGGNRHEDRDYRGHRIRGTPPGAHAGRRRTPGGGHRARRRSPRRSSSFHAGSDLFSGGSFRPGAAGRSICRMRWRGPLRRHQPRDRRTDVSAHPCEGYGVCARIRHADPHTTNRSGRPRNSCGSRGGTTPS